MKKNTRNVRLEPALIGLAVASLFTISLPASAQEKAMGIPWGPVMVYPEADVTFKHNDNIYSQPETGTVRSSNITVLAPRIKVEAKTGPHTFDATYRVEHGAYGNSSSDNYTDQGIVANAAWVFTGRSGLRLTAAYQDGHDDLGSTPGLGVNHSEPDEWHQSSISGVAGYGAEGARGRIEVQGGAVSKRYDNFQLTAAGLPDNTKRDRDDTQVGATFYWRVMPKTQLLMQATQTKFDYKPSSVAGFWTSLDSTDRNYLLGVTWEAAAKTTGIFKFGRVKKDFSDTSLRDFSGSSWDGTVKWSPLTYSTFDFNTGRTTGESTIGNASLDTKYGVTWYHAWNSRVSSMATFVNTRNEYQSNAGTAQTDKINLLGLKLSYQWLRTVKLGAAYDRTDKSSDVPTSEYKRNIYSIFLNAAM